MSLKATTAYPTETRINPALFPETSNGRQEFGGAVDVDATLAGGLARAISEFIGSNTDTERSMNLTGGVPVYRGPPQTTRSLTQLFEGTAEIMQRKIAMDFTERPDPIKAILYTKVVQTKKIIINTPKVTGGGAQLTP